MIRASLDGLVCDLDGVVYRGDRAIPGAAEALRRFTSQGGRVVYCTNNSTMTVARYIDKLARMGVDAREQQLITSAVVTAEVLTAKGFAGAVGLVVGGEGIRGALDAAGVVVDDDPRATPDVVVVGLDLGFDYDAMRRAAAAVRAGAAFVATNDDPSYPVERELWPGAGALLASIETASGRKAEVMGKPHRAMMEAAARRLDGAARIAAVGDQPRTDLDGALAMGWTRILVLSGVTPPEEVDAIDPPPDIVLESLADLESAIARYGERTHGST